MNFELSINFVDDRGSPRSSGYDPSQRKAMELVVEGQRRSICAPARVVLDSGPFWRGYPLQLVRIPAKGMLQHVSTPHHRIFMIAAGSCDVRYRAAARDAKCRLSLGSFCFVSRGYEFERLSWKSTRCEAFVVDITDIGSDPNPIDAFGRTDALFDMYMGLDAHIATLIGLMRSEIDSTCPTGSSYAEALSLALASRIASLCASFPGSAPRAAALSSKQLSRISEHIAKSLPDDLTIETLARLVNMSPFHFARCFKRTTGVTPHQFVTHERIERAKTMLAEGRQPIGDIAMAVGFSSQSHFADVYRRVTGTSARRARNHAGKH